MKKNHTAKTSEMGSSAGAVTEELNPSAIPNGDSEGNGSEAAETGEQEVASTDRRGVKKSKSIEIFIPKFEERIFDAYLVGKSPLFPRTFSDKAKRELLMPAAKKNSAVRQQVMKHDPVQEFWDSYPRFKDDNAPTLIGISGAAPHKAMVCAAGYVPNVFKTEIGRLSFVLDELLPVYGKPYLSMMMVRMADIKKTPDVRTRVVVPHWVAPIRIQFISPMLNLTNCFRLLEAAGIVAGIGDGRPEKGTFNYGTFYAMNPEAAHAEPWKKGVEEILRWGRKEQETAMKAHEPYDAETDDLLKWFFAECDQLGKTYTK